MLGCPNRTKFTIWSQPQLDLNLLGSTGALKKAAENARKDGKSVGCSIVETFGKDATPQELSDVLRLEYRSKLLNPKWAKVPPALPKFLHKNAWYLSSSPRRALGHFSSKQQKLPQQIAPGERF